MKAIRRAIDPAQFAAKSAAIAERLLSLEEFEAARTLFIYVSYLSEVGTYALIEELLACGKTVTVPKVLESPEMSAVQIQDFSDLKPGKFGILEPASNAPFEGGIDLCVTPGLAFTVNGERLGYGRGHYDHFLGGRTETTKIGLAFDEQLVGSIPTDPHDQRMDVVVTDSRVIHCE